MERGTYRQTLQRRGVQPFLWTQFLGAFNDNVCKIIVTFVLMRSTVARRRSQREITGSAFAGAVFIAPFLVFSGYAGRLADSPASGGAGLR